MLGNASFITSFSCHSPVFISNYGFPPFKASFSSFEYSALTFVLWAQLWGTVSVTCLYFYYFFLSETVISWTNNIWSPTVHFWAVVFFLIEKERKSKRKMEGKKYLSTFHSFLWKFVRERVFGRINHNMEKLRSTCWMDSAKSWYSLFVFQCFWFLFTFSRSPWIYLMQFSAQQCLYWLPLSLAGGYLK